MNLSTVKWAQWDKTQSRELLGLFMCAVYCVQLLHTILHRTYLIIFPLALQTITTAPMMSIWGKGGNFEGEKLSAEDMPIGRYTQCNSTGDSTGMVRTGCAICRCTSAHLAKMNARRQCVLCQITLTTCYYYYIYSKHHTMKTSTLTVGGTFFFTNGSSDSSPLLSLLEAVDKNKQWNSSDNHQW